MYYFFQHCPPRTTLSPYTTLFRSRTSPKAFGTIPSNATISRFFDHVADNPEVFAHGLATMASQMRRRVWDTLGGLGPGDRKSTRLNSSHVAISYAVFCLTDKNTTH